MMTAKNVRKSNASDLTEAALRGYRGEPCAALYSSPDWYAYQLGAYFARTGRPEPRDVRMSRGNRVRASDMLFQFV